MKIFGPLGDTQRSDKSPLCFNCKYALIRREVKGNIEIRCNQYGSIVHAYITHCTSHYPSNEPWLNEYESQAWLWSSDDDLEPRFVRMRDALGGFINTVQPIGFRNK